MKLANRIENQDVQDDYEITPNHLKHESSLNTLVHNFIESYLLEK